MFYMGPDPNNDEQLYRLLFDNEIQVELDFSDEQTKALQKAEADFKQAMNQLREARTKGESIVKYREKRDKIIASKSEVMDEVLTPPQRQRLTQIAYNLEISEVGIVDSLVFGRLGNAIGLEDSQREQIILLGKKIKEEQRSFWMELEKELERNLFEELAPEQRVNAFKIIGEPYFFQRKPSHKFSIYRSRRDKAAESRGFSK